MATFLSKNKAKLEKAKLFKMLYMPSQTLKLVELTISSLFKTKDAISSSTILVAPKTSIYVSFIYLVIIYTNSVENKLIKISKPYVFRKNVFNVSLSATSSNIRFKI